MRVISLVTATSFVLVTGTSCTRSKPYNIVEDQIRQPVLESQVANGNYMSPENLLRLNTVRTSEIKQIIESKRLLDMEGGFHKQKEKTQKILRRLVMISCT